jgi:hypothetical protein
MMGRVVEDNEYSFVMEHDNGDQWWYPKCSPAPPATFYYEHCDWSRGPAVDPPGNRHERRKQAAQQRRAQPSPIAGQAGQSG